MGLYNSQKARSLRQEVTAVRMNQSDHEIANADYPSSLPDSDGPDTKPKSNWIKLGAISSAYQAATLLRAYRQTYGVKIVTPHLTQVMALSAFVLLEDLPNSIQTAHSGPQSDSEENASDPQPTWTSESAFEEVFRCLLGAGMQAMLPRGIARMVHRTAEQMHIQLPARVNEFLKITAELVWQPKDLLKLSSRYPNLAILNGNGKKVEEVRMEGLLKKWEKFDTNDQEHDPQKAA